MWDLIFEQFRHYFSPLTLEELFLHVVLFVALYCVNLPTLAVLSDHYRSSLIVLELIMPHPNSPLKAKTK
ncbi:MAG: hypothetical protein SAK29_42735 [Scytonema sp. PMC 1069.18]|nr:hypothetical protein [Scytonema sp. PMC 1069.18]MEC4886553.1 hypothetical protein [Scytonema sp. PMC 1070.18]